MTQPGYGPPAATGERWNVNMPAVIGVVFVFLLGVIIWVVTSSNGDQAAGDAPTITGAPVPDPTAAPTVPPTAAPVTETTSEAPMPDLTRVTASTTTSTTTSTATSTTTSPTTSTTTSTSVPTTTSTTTAPTTTSTTTSPPTTSATTAPAPSTTDGVADVGDLGIDGHPMRRPDCDGSYITVLASAIGVEATAEGIAHLLDTYGGSNYLRTDRTCPSLTPDVGGEPVYVVYFGPVASDTDACAARADGPADAYVRRLSDELGPDHSVACP